MRRVACLALSQIRVEIAREREIGRDVRRRRVAARRRHRAPGRCRGNERDVLGNTRLDVVSREARASGVRAGQTVAAARAKCASLRVRVVAESAVRSGLARVAEVALAFGPSTAFDVATDVVWVEIGGCAHLHGGERELAQALEGRVRALGHACRVVDRRRTAHRRGGRALRAGTPRLAESLVARRARGKGTTRRCAPSPSRRSVWKTETRASSYG